VKVEPQQKEEEAEESQEEEEEEEEEIDEELENIKKEDEKDKKKKRKKARKLLTPTHSVIPEKPKTQRTKQPVNKQATKAKNSLKQPNQRRSNPQKKK